MPRFKPGDQVDKYTILGSLGTGGLGEVYLAKDNALEREVAVKCLRQDLLERLNGNVALFDETSARFWVEAKALARISCPNIPIIIDVHVGEMILIMEFVRGVTLDDWQKTASPDRRVLLDLSISVAETMEAAHAAHVVHRDLTLKNIMMTPGGSVKVLDFGLAKLMDAPAFTQVADWLGTREYMPKEQQTSGVVNERADIFALGVVIYKLVTGSFPYVRNFREDPDPEPPLRISDFKLPKWPQLDHILKLALRPNPDDRYESMEVMLADLRAARASLDRASRALCFVDTSTLFENVCPPQPTASGRKRRKQAVSRFAIQVSRGCAVSSPAVIAELLESVTRLYFEKDRGIDQSELAGIVDDARERVRLYRRKQSKGGLPAWDKLSWEEKTIFVASVQALFARQLRELAARLVAVPIDNGTIARIFIGFAGDLKLPERDARVLSEAWATGASVLLSEERRYRKRQYAAVLRYRKDTYYDFCADESDPGDAPAAGGVMGPLVPTGAPPRATGAVTETLD